MTHLDRPVRRIVPHERRNLVITLHPGSPPEIEIREARRRLGYRVSVAWLYSPLARRAAGLPTASGRRRNPQ